jgi:hypothetical protein
MSLVRVVSAGERIVRLQFSDGAEYREHALQIGGYSCSGCRCVVEFRTEDFPKHEGTRLSNLDPACRGRFDVARQSKPPVGSPFWIFIQRL